MNLLLIHEQTEVREILRFGVESRFTIPIYESKNVDDAIQLLEQFQANKSAYEILKKAHSNNDAVKILEDKTDMHLIVCEDSPKIAKLLDFLKKQHLAVSVVIWASGKLSLSKPLEAMVYRTLMGKDIIPDVVKIMDELNVRDRFQATEGVVKPSLDDIYCPIKTSLLIRVSPLKSDIYIRLSEKKYIRLFPEGSTFDLEDLKKYYKERKVEYLYLHRDEVSEFLEKFHSDLDELIASDPLNKDAANRAVSEAHETMHDLLNRTGFTEDVQELAKQSVKLTIKAMGESPELIAILERLKEGREKYITTHSTLLAHIACAMSACMTWNSSNTYEKLTMAAFMHDITLKNQNIAEIDTLAELEKRKAEFTEEDIRAYRNHPIEASMMVRKMNKIPADVDAIIAQHHERADGSGFPRGVTHTHIAHLSCLFIIAHDLTRYIMEREVGYSFSEFVELRKGVYSKGNFRKIFEMLVKEMVKMNHL